MTWTRTNDWRVTEGTSFHGDILHTTYAKLVKALGTPPIDGSEKTQAEWFLTDGRDAVSIYDWKEYDTPVDRVTEWHIGAKDPATSQRALRYLSSLV